MIRRTASAFLAALLAIFTTFVPGADSLRARPSNKLWQLVFSDAFDGTTLDEGTSSPEK